VIPCPNLILRLSTKLANNVGPAQSSLSVRQGIILVSPLQRHFFEAFAHCDTMFKGEKSEIQKKTLVMTKESPPLDIRNAPRGRVYSDDDCFYYFQK